MFRSVAQVTDLLGLDVLVSGSNCEYFYSKVSSYGHPSYFKIYFPCFNFQCFVIRSIRCQNCQTVTVL